jgi:holin-like protein
LNLHHKLSVLLSLALIILFQLLGDFIHNYFNTPIPGAVIGMLLFFTYLCLTGGSSTNLIETGSKLLKHLPLLFVPAGVGIITYTNELKTQGVAIIASLTLGTLIAFVLTLLILKKLKPSPISQTISSHDDA